MRRGKLVAVWGVAGTFSAFGMAGASDAAMIGINIQGGGSATAGPVLDTANVGVTSVYQQTHWNNIIPNQPVVPNGLKATYTSPLGDVSGGGSLAGGGSFLDSSGTAVSGLTIIWAGTNGANSWTHPNGGSPYLTAPPDSGPLSGTTADANNMFDGYAYNGGTNNTSFQIQNIPYSSYSLVVYTSEGLGRVGSADVTTNNGVTGYDSGTGLPTGGTSVSRGSIESSALSSWTLDTSSTAGNYFVISGLSGSDQTVTFANTANEFDINAIQIVGASAVPEPTSLSLLALGGLALIRRPRRANAE